MQTIAANLGSMLTPIGNPQNLYLYGKSGMSIGGFVLLMLPYTLVSLLLLLAWACLLYTSLFCNSFLQHHPTPLAGHRQEKTEKIRLEQEKTDGSAEPDVYKRQ